MKFARIVFYCAGTWGVLVIVPMYFLFSKIGQYSPPPATHPEIYYGFVGVTLAWQFVFFLIATNPARFRPMIVAAVFEKLSYVAAVVILYARNEITGVQSSTAVPDASLGLLFVIGFLKMRPFTPAITARVNQNIRPA